MSLRACGERDGGIGRPLARNPGATTAVGPVRRGPGPRWSTRVELVRMTDASSPRPSVGTARAMPLPPAVARPAQGFRESHGPAEASVND
jgi:hypothetical protein